MQRREGEGGRGRERGERHLGGELKSSGRRETRREEHRGTSTGAARRRGRRGAGVGACIRDPVGGGFRTLISLSVNMGQKTLKSTLCKLRSSQTFWARMSAESKIGRQLVTSMGQPETAMRRSM